MAVNLLEEDRLVYHDFESDTLEVNVSVDFLIFECLSGQGEETQQAFSSLDRDAVETLRDSLTCWLQSGKLK